MHRERKGPMNVIFYLSQSVDIEIFVFDNALVNQSHQDMGSFWSFTTITSRLSCLDCWRSSVILMSILWGAAFPWVSYYTLQGYLYKKKNLKKNENCHSPHGGFAENHIAHLEQRLDSSFFVVMFLIHCNNNFLKNPIKHYCATSKVKRFYGCLLVLSSIHGVWNSFHWNYFLNHWGESNFNLFYTCILISKEYMIGKQTILDL